MLKKVIPAIMLVIFGACGENNTPETNKQLVQDTNKVVQDTKPIASNAKDAPALVDMLNTSDNFSLFTSYLNTTLSDMLSKEEEYTVLAPTNKAIEKLGEAQMAKMLNKGASFVKNHIVKGKFELTTLKNTPEITTLQGTKLKVSIQGENITIGNVRVVAADIYAKNGVIHALDGVID